VSTLAGYSGTPLARKLGIKACHRLLLYSAPEGWTVPDLPEAVSVLRKADKADKADVIVAFFAGAQELAARVERLSQAFTAGGSLWLAWPRRAAGHESDITDNVVRQIVLPLGLVDVKVAALDHDWSALKFVWRKERGAEHRRSTLAEELGQ
jgi:hypothetical protein